MQIHDLNTGTPAATDVLAMDTGSDTYKTTPGNVVPDYTSGDSSTATSWTSVTAVASGLSLSTLIGRITTMMKNVRYLYNLLGSSTFSTVASTITGAIGNTALGTTATTLSGAIAEHEGDIGTLNSNISSISGCEAFTLTKGSTMNDGGGRGYYDKSTKTVRLSFYARKTSGTISTSEALATVPSAYRPSGGYSAYGFVVTNSGTVPYFLTVAANGNITQGASSNAVGAFGFAEYPI